MCCLVLLCVTLSTEKAPQGRSPALMLSSTGAPWTYRLCPGSSLSGSRERLVLVLLEIARLLRGAQWGPISFYFLVVAGSPGGACSGGHDPRREAGVVSVTFSLQPWWCPLQPGWLDPSLQSPPGLCIANCRRHSLPDYPGRKESLSTLTSCLSCLNNSLGNSSCLAAGYLFSPIV